VQSLVRTYGRGLTGLFVALVAFWIIVMIALPQWRMIERAFTYEDRGGDTAMLALSIDRAYSRKFQLEGQIRRLGSQAAQVEEGATGSLLSPSLPSPSLSTPSPSVPSPSLPSPSTPSPSLPSPSLGGAGQSELSEDERRQRIDELRAEVAELDIAIADMEGREDLASGEAGMQEQTSLRNFTDMSGLHFRIFLMTLLYALFVTILSFLICYPVAYAAAMSESPRKLTLILLGLIIPYAINELLRIFSWVMILEKNGILNAVFDAVGIIDMSAGEGFRFVASNGAVFTVMIYAYVLFMIFPIYNTIDTLDKNQVEAARDLGGSIWKIHTRVVIPHAKPGIAVGSIMTFMLSAGSIAAPEIVGRGLHPDWFSQLIYRRFFEADSWNQGSAYSLALLIACIAFILLNMWIFKVGIRDIAK
jgi:spermidine/putrescine transport system permease protein